MERCLVKKILIALIITFTIIFNVSTTLANQRIAQLEKSVEAHQLAMTFANKAIHTLYNKSKETL
jgi:hypothetical protein